MEKTNSTARFVHRQTGKSFEEVDYCTWSELLIALKECQELPPLTNSSVMLEKCMDLLVQKIVLADRASPCPSASSVDSSRFRLSCDSKSTESLKTNFACTTWWFEDLFFLSPESVQVFIQSMISHEFDQVLLTKFLVCFQKSKFLTAASDEKRKMVESVIDVFETFDKTALSLKALFDILRVSSGLKINKGRKKQLEAMIGSKLDQATLDNLLVPSPIRMKMNYLYDVNLVLRLFKANLSGGINQSSPSQLTKLASLMDLYMAEVAPDPRLKSSKFLALAMAVPDSARKSYDDMYHAIDLYFEIHAGISAEEKVKLCSALNYEKLSYEVCMHFSKNPKFPSTSLPQTPIHPVKCLLQNLNYSKPLIDWPCNIAKVTDINREENRAHEQIVLFHGKLDFPADDEKFKVQMEGMQWRVMELEKLCTKMQTQMRKILKSRVANFEANSLPKLCS